MLTGVLGGGAYGTVPYSNPARQDVAHQLIAYHIEWFVERGEFYRCMGHQRGNCLRTGSKKSGWHMMQVISGTWILC